MPKKIRGRSALLAVAALALAGGAVTLAQPPAARPRIDDKNMLHLEGAKADQPYLVLRQDGAKPGPGEHRWVVAGRQATLPLERSLAGSERVTVYAVEPKATCDRNGCRQCTPRECPVPPSPPPIIK